MPGPENEPEIVRWMFDPIALRGAKSEAIRLSLNERSIARPALRHRTR